ncbi:hypothetical protein K439DRAFT_1623531 [Ramaria rubella]|nr:hypothetical protein K439DRAFT_1623531 [Ramaria rubella]
MDVHKCAFTHEDDMDVHKYVFTHEDDMDIHECTLTPEDDMDIHKCTFTHENDMDVHVILMTTLGLSKGRKDEKRLYKANHKGYKRLNEVDKMNRGKVDINQ